MKCTYLRIWFFSERECRYVCFPLLHSTIIEWSEFTHQIIHVRQMNTINWKTTIMVCVWYTHSINPNFHWLRNGVYTREINYMHTVCKWDIGKHWGGNRKVEWKGVVAISEKFGFTTLKLFQQLYLSLLFHLLRQ
jgi:hypothetical protein